MKSSKKFAGKSRLALKSEQLKILAVENLEDVAGGGTSTKTGFCNICTYTEMN